MSSYSFEPVCGLTGCQKPKVEEITILEKGQRAVCADHLEALAEGDVDV